MRNRRLRLSSPLSLVVRTIIEIMVTILATKLNIPRAQSILVPRSRLRTKLNNGLRRKLTLVTASAGFGKTTLLGAWVNSHDMRAAWLSLDEGDNDTTRFLRHLIASIGRVLVNLYETVQGILDAPQPPPLEAVLTSLINELNDEETSLTIVLDDYHVIKTAAVHDALTFLLEHLPPTVHLIIASRTDPPLPLARLRARGELNEIRTTDLRFTPEETTAFLNGTMSLNLLSDEIDALEVRTEGWIAGLQLAALAMQGHTDPSSFIAAFTGSHRYIMDYLVEDVLRLQPEAIQRFLLQTSILERLTGPLCDAVTLNHDGAGMLELLERSNLFLVPLDEERRWYRYHHLFAEVLRNRLQQLRPEELLELHRRATGWLEREGLFAEATDHALAAGDVEWAARLVETLAETLWPRGELTSLLMWLDRLPEEVLPLKPRLLLVGAWTHFLLRSYNSQKVEELLAEAETAIGKLPVAGGVTQEAGEGETSELKGMLAAIRTAVASAREEAPQTLAHAQEALTKLPEDRVLWRIVPVVSAGIAHDAIGDARAADRTLTEAIALSQAVGNNYIAQVATMNLARVRVVQGRLHSAAELSEQALKMAGEQRGGRSPVVSYPHVLLGKLLYEQNNLAGAARHLKSGIERAQLDEHLRSLLDGRLALVRLLHATRDTNGAEEIMRRAEEVARSVPLPWAAPLVAAHRARFALWLGRVAEATHWAEEMGLSVNDTLDYSREVAYITLARVLNAKGQLDDALQLLKRLAQAAEALGRWGSLLEIRVLQALTLQERRDMQGALTVLEQGLSAAEPEGYTRLFIDEGEPIITLLQQALAQGVSPEYTSTLLDAFQSERVAVAPKPMTTSLETPLFNEREMSVLRFMASRMSDKEIARELHLSVNTIKWYSSKIYEKLAAHRRSEAVRRAKELDIL